MPLPFILGAAAAVAAAGGVGSGIHGAVKMKEANDTANLADNMHQRNVAYFEMVNEGTNKIMDELGRKELDILHGFAEFSDTIEKIQNKPQFKEYHKEGIKLPQYNKEEIEKVSVGAGVLLGGLSGAAAGAAGGFAAAGATTSAVMALGTASTGTAIASLSGVAATNATLATLGGGAIAAGGGGMALGSAILSATTLGAGVLVGGVIFNLVGEKLSDQADQAWNQMLEAQKKIKQICKYLEELRSIAKEYMETMDTVSNKYKETFGYISYLVNNLHKTDWNAFSNDEKLAIQNTVLLVGLLYKMCQVSLVVPSSNKEEINSVNYCEVQEAINNAEVVMGELVFN